AGPDDALSDVSSGVWALTLAGPVPAGIPIKSTMDNSTTIQYAGLMHSFIMKARSTVRDIDPQNDLTFLRIRSKKNEIMVAPDKDYFLIVIQNPTE
ncbi:DLRB1 protein, partial [Atlantisia rogersi]|nr:DLRB1 protein [Atlantisia rogersi]